MPHCHTELQLIRISKIFNLQQLQPTSSCSLLLYVVQLQCAFVISSDTGGRKCQYAFECAKAAFEDKREPERAVGHVI